MGFWLRETTHLKNKSGLNRVLSGRLGHESTKFCRVFTHLVFCLTHISSAIELTRYVDLGLIIMV
jgi:hypothetical protein